MHVNYQQFYIICTHERSSPKGTSLLIHAHNRSTRHDSYTANYISCLSEKILVYYTTHWEKITTSTQGLFLNWEEKGPGIGWSHDTQNIWV